MKLPMWPAAQQLSQITPAFYNAALICPARALWGQFGSRDAFPNSPSSITGRSFHAVIEAALSGKLPADPEQRRAAAYARFDEVAVNAWTVSHSLIRWRYPTADKLPRYYALRAEAGEEVAGLVGTGTGTAASGRKAELGLSSRDGQVAGRVDLYDPNIKAIVDYKTGEAEEDGISATEARQLRIYAYLALENQLQVDNLIIVRGSGERSVLPVDVKDIDEEVRRARSLLSDINHRLETAKGIEDLAEPTPDNCRFCRCRPICEPFWRSSNSEWAESAGSCCEGTIHNLSTVTTATNTALILDVRIARGSISSGEYVTENLPLALFNVDGSALPVVGDRVRMVDLSPTSSERVLRARRHGVSTVWSD